MKTTLLAGLLLLCSSNCFAQGFHSGGGGGGTGGGNWGGAWGNGCGWCNAYGYDASSSFGFGSSGVRYGPPATFAVSYAKNDGDYVPSIYMDYQDALELGRRQLAAIQEANEHPVSLGEIARAYRAAKLANPKPSASAHSNPRRAVPIPPPPPRS